MKTILFSFLFYCLLCAPIFASNQVQAKTEKVLVCTEKGCSCEGKGCNFVDPRIIKNSSTVSITCSDSKKCGEKIVYQLKDKYGCKASVQNLHDQDYLVSAECLILDVGASYLCPSMTLSEPILELIKICLQVPVLGEKSK